MGNRFPRCRRALRAGRAVRACVLVWGGGGTPPRHLTFSSPLAPAFLPLLPRERVPAEPLCPSATA